MTDVATHPPQTLRRELGVFGAVMMGLGSIVGTGVFVSIGVAAGVAGTGVLVAIVLAAGLATFNALNSAQLAASHPVSGGTYEYGYRYLRPWAGFSAGWMFLCAKSASAATAALGFSGYLLNALGVDPSRTLLVTTAIVTAVLLTAIVLAGMRLSSRVNIAIVSITIVSLAAFVAFGSPTAISNASQNLTAPHWSGLAEATALMFVAYTGYGRIATLGEEVRDPRKTIPRATIITLWFSAILYIAIALVAVATTGADTLGQSTRQHAAPLETVARRFAMPGVHAVVTLGAMAAMLGVLLNLILGLSRVLLAMGRRGDMPRATAKLDSTGRTPHITVLIIGLIITALITIGNVKTTWSFSAFSVLIYYAITNWSALHIAPEDRLYPKWTARISLAACLALAFWVNWHVWTIGVGVLAVGIFWHIVSRRRQNSHPTP